MPGTKLEPAALRKLCLKVKHLISRKFVLAQTAKITIWELSQNGTNPAQNNYNYYPRPVRMISMIIINYLLMEKGK